MGIAALDSDIRNAAELVGEFLTIHSLTLTTSESCTGGLVSAALTDIPGSSEWFEYGFVTYADRAKTDLLDVPKKVIDEHGAVSEQTAIAMAKGARKNAFADVALSITGIAGPDGGTDEKPVGTVCFAWILPGEQSKTVTRRFHGDRLAVRQQATAMALSHLIDLLISQNNF